MSGAKSRTFDRGRWQLQRERCRLESERPPPPPREATPLSATVDALARRLLGRAASGASAPGVAERWRRLVGDRIAAHSRPGSYRNGFLTVYVESNGWLSEIERFERRGIERRIRASGRRAFSGIRLRLDPEGPDHYRQGNGVE